MARTIGFGLGALFLAIGGGAVVAPRFSAAQYGVPSDDAEALAFVRATGARDMLLGGLIFASLGDRAALRRTLAWSALVGLADAGIVFARHGARPAHAVHLGGFAALSLAALALRERGA
jgi:hypothetical protein